MREEGGGLGTFSRLRLLLSLPAPLPAVGATIADPSGAGGANATLLVWSRDAGAASFGHPTGFPIPLAEEPAAAEGAAFMLANTVWGTNYPQWLPWKARDADVRWEFSIVSAA